MSSFTLTARRFITQADTAQTQLEIETALRSSVWIHDHVSTIGNWRGSSNLTFAYNSSINPLDWSGWQNFRWEFEVLDNVPGTPDENLRRVHDIASVVLFHATNALSTLATARGHGGLTGGRQWQDVAVGNFSIGAAPAPVATPRRTTPSTPASSPTDYTPSQEPAAQPQAVTTSRGGSAGIPTPVVILGALALGGGIWWWLHREPASPYAR